MSKTGIIYKITNNINNKVYIGATYQCLKSRFSQHLREVKYGSKLKIHSAIREFGKENFSIEEICRTVDKNKLYLLERKYIKFFNSKDKGYNSTDGGIGVGKLWLGRKHKESTKIIMSEKMKGNKNGSFRTNFVKVDLLDSEGNVIKTYNSVKEAALDLDIKSPTDISNFCRGNKKSFNKGYIFKYNGRYYNSKNKI